MRGSSQGTLGVWQVLAVAGTSPGGSLGLEASPRQCTGEAGNAGPEVPPDCGEPDYPPTPTPGSRCGAETLLNAHTATAQPISRGLSLPHHHYLPEPDGADAYRFPGACPAQGARLPSYLPHEAPGAGLSVPSLGQTCRDRRKPGEVGLSFPRGRLVSSPPHLPPPSLLTPTSNP